jgi:hypothetical protein
MAHGITAPLALLGLTHRDSITVDGQTTAITRICHWLDTWQQHTNQATWWPQTVSRAELDRGIPAQQGPLRPSWCYGTPGIARAQQLAGLALRDAARQRLAEAAFTSAINDPSQTRRLTERGLCHGTAGLLATARRIAADALTPIPVTPIEALHRQVTPAGDEQGGLLDGSAGSDLAIVVANATSWDACLLLT